MQGDERDPPAGPAAERGGPTPPLSSPPASPAGELPRFPGFREIAARRRRVVGELARSRRESGLSQTTVAARMGTSQSVVARLESGALDVRLSTLERYAEAVGRRLGWQLSEPGEEKEEASS